MVFLTSMSLRCITVIDVAKLYFADQGLRYPTSMPILVLPEVSPSFVLSRAIATITSSHNVVCCWFGSNVNNLPLKQWLLVSADALTVGR